MGTYQELLLQLEQLKREIEMAREKEARLIAAEIANVLASHGVRLEEILGSGVRSRKTEVRPKYWDPETGATWSGRGRMPLWLVGQDLEKFRLPRQDES
ncbi:H-NS histone [Burkholderia ubonensis]|nr:H-NS histone family protein [Burkholderia ubonensis]KVP64343.1 H-NS histone [Burkholderia ubonensis]KVR05409.1 H-NS histone [Burkholderia ubonensis]KVR78679.1 H-NS histone [Burkholderia ubonensis]KVX07538.1 H-NS histone [Burkholderia ubonensis]KWB30465.1 H-NS histone [Burkholderia ubonensis]